MKSTCQTCKQPFEFEPVLGFNFQPKSCPACAEANESKVLKEEQDQKNAAKQAKLGERWLRICPPLYRETDVTKLNLDRLNAVMKWEFGPKGLIVLGATGLQKTRCIYQLLSRLHFTEGRSVIALASHDFSRECAVRFGNNEGEEWISRLLAADVVFFDDLGKFKFTERIESELFGVIEGRIANLKPILATTNFKGEDFAQKMSEDRGLPILRRLREFCDTVRF